MTKIVGYQCDGCGSLHKGIGAANDKYPPTLVPLTIQISKDKEPVGGVVSEAVDLCSPCFNLLPAYANPKKWQKPEQPQVQPEEAANLGLGKCPECDAEGISVDDVGMVTCPNQHVYPRP